MRDGEHDALQRVGDDDPVEVVDVHPLCCTSFEDKTAYPNGTEEHGRIHGRMAGEWVQRFEDDGVDRGKPRQEMG